MSSSNPVSDTLDTARDQYDRARERALGRARPVWRAAMDRVRPFRQRQIRVTRTVADRIPVSISVPYIFLMPFFLLFTVFLAFPILYTFYLSFHTYQGVSSEVLLTIYWPIDFKLTRIAELQFVGLDNYVRMLGDSLFHNAMANTFFLLLIQVPLMIGIALGLAIALNASWMRFKGVFRTTIALPVSANLVAYATVFLLMLQDQGIINYFLTALGLPAIPWLTNGFWTRMSMVGSVTWRWTGYNMIILLAGLQNVSQQLYEAAEIDGATRIQKFRHVTLPQLRPVLLFVFVTSTIGTMRLFSEPLILDEGGAPSEATRTIVLYIYRMAFGQFQFGYASAMTVVLVVLVAVLSIVQLRVGGGDDA